MLVRLLTDVGNTETVSLLYGLLDLADWTRQAITSCSWGVTVC